MTLRQWVDERREEPGFSTSASFVYGCGRDGTVERRIELVNTRPGERLDRFLSGWLDGVSRSQVQRWIQEGKVTVNGHVSKASRRLEVGDTICLLMPDEESDVVQPWEASLSVVYEDKDCAVVDKPAGLVVHPATSHQRHTLANALLARYPEMTAMVSSDTEAASRPGIVHRLDKDTSGLIVVARHKAARAALQRQFKKRKVEKVYLALLYGRLSPPEGRVDAGIGRDPRNRKRMAVVQMGREAITEYSVRQFLLTPHGAREHYTLAEARPLTGRTHQIRVHFAHIGHSVVGDVVYGRRRQRLSCPRQFLHAWRLGFHRPDDGKWIVFESPLPSDLEAVLSQVQPVV